MRGLVSGADGSDVLVRAGAGRVPVAPGGVLPAAPVAQTTAQSSSVADVGWSTEVDVTGVPFGLVEIVVLTGVGAGLVYRLETGRYRCGVDPDADLRLPSAGAATLQRPTDDVEAPPPGSWWVDVRWGAQVWVGPWVTPEGRPTQMRWEVGERRTLGGLDLLLRWCDGPARGPQVSRPRRGLALADVLLDRVRGVPLPSTTTTAAPEWELGRWVPDEGASPTGPDPELVTPDAPLGPVVALPIRRFPCLVVRGAMRAAFARSVLGRLVVAAGPQRLRLTLLAPGGGDRERASWAWLRWLPHGRTPGTEFVRAGFDPATCERLVADLAEEQEGVLDVVVVDGPEEGAPALSRPGLAVLVLESDGVRDDDHEACHARDENDLEDSARTLAPGPAHRAARHGSGTAAESPGPVVDVAGPRAVVHGVPGVSALDVDLPEVAWSDRLGRSLTRFDDEPSAPGRLADLIGSSPDDEAVYRRRWSGPMTTRVAIGWRTGTDSAPVTVDLRTDGPHALVGGTTGAGKSELLLTLVASLAAANPPEAMSFLLVDYKGGAAFAECASLPHTVGVVTDLDSALTERALASLSAEILRRERLLAEAGATDIDALLAAGRGPLARLVIVVDEFATLAADLPEFVDGLVDIARRGRSLGLHLVLATQRPAGVVSADIRANTTLRISLRVAEASDSMDVVGIPDAVDFDETQPGRALIRVGQNAPTDVRVARVTTTSADDGLELVPYRFGEPVAPALARSDLARMATTMTAVVERYGFAGTSSPWLPPLPERVGPGDLVDQDAGFDEVGAYGGAAGPGRRFVVPFGLEDRPSEQRRALAVLDLEAGVPLAVIGSARSGRTGVLAALAAAVRGRFTPAEVHVYAIDAGSRGLLGLEDGPNVGAVVHRDEPDRLERLVARLILEVDRRVQSLALQRLRDVAEQRAQDPEHAWPYLMVLVDRWDQLAEAAEAVDDQAFIGGLERLAAEGGRVGIVVVATGDRSMLAGRGPSVFPDRLVLRLSDAHDYAAVGVEAPAGGGVPGRGWRGPDAVETQVVMPDATAAFGQADAPPAWSATNLYEGAGDLPGVTGAAVTPRQEERSEGGPFRIDPLPVVAARADVSDLLAEPRPAGALAVAVGGDELGARWLDADEFGPCALVTGRRRTGRSGTLLTLAESALDQGWEVAVVVARRSPVTAILDGEAAQGGVVHGVYRDDEDAPRLAAVVRRCVETGTRLLVVADDVDLMLDGPLLDELEALPVVMRDSGCLFVGAAEAEEIVASYRGPALALRRARFGVMLSPQGSEDGEAFGVRLRRGQYERALGAGAGYLVVDGLLERVQVIRSPLLPDPRRQV